MIPRYEKNEISSIWSDQNKFKTYLKVELAVLRAMEDQGTVPKGTADQIESRAVINPQRIDEIEKTVKHDIIAFCTSITENIDAEQARFFHFGVTSSDIIDTSLTLQIKESLDVIIPSLKKLKKTLFQKAVENKDLLTIGRSHGIFAEPMSFGQKFLGYYCEFSRRLQDLQNFYENELTAQFSGAVGNYCILSPAIEQEAATLLGLKIEPVSTQVIPRDRLAKLIQINGLIASAIERLAVEIRHLHRSDVNELHEGFDKGQKGSSTMPHKKNPISGENLTGMARVLRSHVGIALDNIVLWHERDISHSSTERLYLPDNLGLLFYSLERLDKTVNNLALHNDEIEAKVNQNTTYLSSYFLHFLIQSTEFKREDLYPVVQKASFESIQSNSHEKFFEIIADFLHENKVEAELPRPDQKTIRNIYLKNIEAVFERAYRTYGE